MRTIDVGVLLSDRVEISFCGTFLCGGAGCSGNATFSVAEGRVEWCGNRYERLLFAPQSEDCSFTIRDVVIGIDFHWERREDQSFRGELLLFVEDDKVRVVNRIDVEEYLISVISSEMSASSSLELLKAHAVVSRSWLYAQLERSAKSRNENAVLGWSDDDEIVRWYAREDHRLFDFCADDHCQRYQGITRAANPNVAQAVKDTENLVLMYNGEVCDARFSKCCGGITENFSSCWESVDVPYLSSFRDAVPKGAVPDVTTEDGARGWIEGAPDAFCAAPDASVLAQVLNGYDRETNDFYRWSVQYSQSELSALVARKSGIDFGDISELQPLQRGASGRIIKLKIVGSKRTMVVGKELEIRRWLSGSHLYSSAFVVDKFATEDGSASFILKGAGWGHGVGLCQIGAAVMGEQGYGYSEILEHYYPETKLGII